jgi:hypothetical protein
MFVFKHVFHMKSNFFKNDVAACFEIVNHSFASFLINASDFFSYVQFKFTLTIWTWFVHSFFQIFPLLHKCLTDSNLVKTAAMCTVSLGKSLCLQISVRASGALPQRCWALRHLIGTKCHPDYNPSCVRLE